MRGNREEQRERDKRQRDRETRERDRETGSRDRETGRDRGRERMGGRVNQRACARCEGRQRRWEERERTGTGWGGEGGLRQDHQRKHLWGSEAQEESWTGALGRMSGQEADAWDQGELFWE